MFKVGDKVKLSEKGLSWLYLSPRRQKKRQWASLRIFIVVGFGKEGIHHVRVTPTTASPFTIYTYLSSFLAMA